MLPWLRSFLISAACAAVLVCPALGQDIVGNPAVNRAEYPDTSLADFSFLVPAPAGTRGFLTTRPDGRFYFGDGKRARFWGVNVSSRSINIPDDEIEAAVLRFRRAGFNMLRLEATDNVGMLLDTDGTTSRRMNPAYLRKMHRWMALARRHGLYTYLQLLDFRTFHEGDGVPNAAALGRAAKPYAFFDPKLIELQKEYATQLLETVNPFIGMKPIEDPAVALIELVNEHGLFIKGSAWKSLAPPYDKAFQDRWNTWLKARYKTTAALAKAWAGPDGQDALGPDESLEEGTVALPDMANASREGRAKPFTDPRRAPARLDDGAHFAYDVQRDYFREMRAYLRGRGVKVPITAVVTTWVAPDVKSVADELDFTAENWYWDHPAFEPEKEWRAPFYYANIDPLSRTDAWNAPPYMAALRWKGKPVVIREWAAVWPNQYRASGVPLAAAYAALQDIDAMLAFGYSFYGNNKVSDFNYERDPVRWGLMGLAATLYLRGDVEPFRDTAQLVYDDKALFTYQDYLNSLYRLAWIMRLESVSADDAKKTGGGRQPLLSLPAQPADPPAALKAAVARVYDRDRNVDEDLTRIGLLQGRQIVAINTSDRYFTVVTDRTAILAGRLSGMAAMYPGFSTRTPYGALWVGSLDGQKLAESDHFLIKMVSLAENTGEEFAKSEGPHHPDRFALKSTGSAPILTRGERTDSLTVFPLTEDANLKVGMVNGTWEFERNGDVARFYCDTPGIPVTVGGAESAVAYMDGGQTQPLPLKNGAFTYPEEAAYVELRMADSQG